MLSDEVIMHILVTNFLENPNKKKETQCHLRVYSFDLQKVRVPNVDANPRVND